MYQAMLSACLKVQTLAQRNILMFRRCDHCRIEISNYIRGTTSMLCKSNLLVKRSQLKERRRANRGKGPIFRDLRMQKFNF